ncbi:MAG: ATP-dependent helicase [Caldilineaceae bacterium]|nr:ATP-dependent helicase [Caldilineaceae bacterium]
MDNLLELSLRDLTDIQCRAVHWNDGALLVLAGPGSGKTRVLTCRVARLLESSRDDHFRILALTFTNKAAHEMANRVAALVPGLSDRADIDTFHGFCAQVVRQHGVHLGIKPNFAIYSRSADRQAVLEDALRRDSQRFGSDIRRLLSLIDDLKARMITPEQAGQCDIAWKGVASNEGDLVARAYRLYEDELRRANALDFNSLILEAYKLLGYPAMARHYQTVYRYWLIDEFQDTNGAQYELLRRMAGEHFREIFAVADDDQTIYEWNGANVRRIGTLVEEFACEVVQLPTNFRCPPQIVEAANRLVVYNASRVASKQKTKSAPGKSTNEEQVQCRVFKTDRDEVKGIAAEIAGLDVYARARTAVLARNRVLLESMYNALKHQNVPATILARRDDFVSPEMRWLVACLRQINRPLDRRNMTTLVESFGSFSSLSLDFDELVSRSVVNGVTYLSVWMEMTRDAALPSPVMAIVDAVERLAAGRTTLTPAIQQILDQFDSNDAGDDLKEDLSAWQRLSREIRVSQGFTSLERFLQELDLRSKEPVPSPGTVFLATIHGAKGLEFETVYLIGLAEEVLPSWHSVKKGVGSAALEEERRSCFVAITRARHRLILSRADQYKGWPKPPSRFLQEMGMLNGGSSTGLYSQSA